MNKDKDKKHEGFDPEKDKEVENGPQKREHKNQYGENPGGKDRNMSKRVQNQKNKDQK